MKFLSILTIAFAMLAGAANAAMTVNGAEVSAEVRAQLAAAYGDVPDGAYWYDPMTGLWGVEGGPGIGRIVPALDFGAPLKANASGGGDGRLTGVFINAREIHPEELALLQGLFGYVAPGRYWLGADLVGGYEGSPALFDLRAAAQQQSGGPGYNKSTLFGDLMSDGQCAGYLHPSGASVMTGNC
jgi:hypothetical protein